MPFIDAPQHDSMESTQDISDIARVRNRVLESFNITLRIDNLNGTSVLASTDGTGNYLLPAEPVALPIIDGDVYDELTTIRVSRDQALNQDMMVYYALTIVPLPLHNVSSVETAGLTLYPLPHYGKMHYARTMVSGLDNVNLVRVRAVPVSYTHLTLPTN